MQPSAVIFYHSAGGAIYVGGCQEPGALWLSQLLADATGYANAVVFEAYPLSGTAEDWLDDRGVAAVTVELSDRSDPELARNLIGLMALQCHYALNGNTGILTPAIEQQCSQLDPFSPSG